MKTHKISAIEVILTIMRFIDMRKASLIARIKGKPGGIVSKYDSIYTNDERIINPNDLKLKAMKTLMTILLLMLCLNGRGQYFVDLQNGITVDAHGVVRYFLEQQPNHIMTYENILQNWSEYKQECYADSVSHCTAYWMKDLNSWQWPCEQTDPMDKPYVKAVITYTYKQPSFEGFMEFLNKKYGQNN
jgi:hypothetical protein